MIVHGFVNAILNCDIDACLIVFWLGLYHIEFV